MKKYCVVLLVSFWSLSAIAQTDHSNDEVAAWKKKLSLEFSLGAARMNGRTCNQAVTFRGGFGNIFLTGRMFRAGGYIFENSWMAGYRFHPHRLFNITGSIGFSDVAVRKSTWSVYTPEFDPSRYHKGHGICGEIEVELRLHRNKKPTAFGIVGAYYYTINTQRNLSVASLGVKWSLLPLVFERKNPAIRLEKAQARKEWRALRKKHIEEETVIPKNTIRTKFGIGIIAATHVEYERNIDNKAGFTIGLAARYISLYTPLHEVAMGYDAPLNGTEINAGFNFYKPTLRGWWSFGFKTAFRHREKWDYRAYMYGDYQKVSRKTNDILILNRIAYTTKPKSKVHFMYYFAAGTRISDYWMKYPQHLGPGTIEEKGWAMYPSVSLGVDIGFGW